jgi:hypothetical protein
MGFAMTQKDNLRFLLLFSLLVLALAGYLLHTRIHPLEKDAGNIIPAVSGILSIVVITLLFCFRRTVAYGYVLNGMTVILGTIAMAHYSLKHPPEVWTLQTAVFRTLLPDIIILWGKFAVGKALFELELFRQPEAPARTGRFFRYPNMGYWWVHLLAISIVYSLGIQYWK